jgi:hypothetical protein
MRLPEQLDPALKALFDPAQKPPDYDEWFHILQEKDKQTDYRWISEAGYDIQADFLLRLKNNRRKKNRNGGIVPL